MIARENLSVDGSDMLILSAKPEAAGPHPVYIECCHAPGQDGFTEKVLERMAESGYAANSHNLFHRQGPDAAGRDAMGNLTDEEMVRDTEALIGHLGGLDACDTGRLTIGGHCMGGRVALLAGASISGFSAIADFWGGNVMTAKGREAPTVIDMVANITCPVVGFFGNDDGNPSPEDVDRLDAELSKHGIAHSFHRYDGAGHAFQNFLNEANYRESQAEDAWGKVIDFFGEALALRSRRLVTKTSSTSPS
jgi:carboxymethylenebutenolidase